MLKGVCVAAALAAAVLTPDGAHGAGAENDLLVSTDWLASHLRDPNLVLLHVGDQDEFRATHIPGARYISLRDISATSQDGLDLQLPPASELRRHLQALGISDNSHVVVYYGNDWVSPSTRIVFTLYAAGLGDHVDLLDGGMGKWRREGRPVTAAAPAAPTPGALAELTLRPVVVDADFLRAHVGQPGYVVIDARARVFYDGVESSGAHGHRRNGHIPGAHSLPFTSVTNDDMTFKSPAELAALFHNAGVQQRDHVIAYCHIGQQATAVLFAARAAGIDAVLYDGSFEDWSIRNLPVER